MDGNNRSTRIRFVRAGSVRARNEIRTMKILVEPASIKQSWLELGDVVPKEQCDKRLVQKDTYVYVYIYFWFLFFCFCFFFCFLYCRTCEKKREGITRSYFTEIVASFRRLYLQQFRAIVDVGRSYGTSFVLHAHGGVGAGLRGRSHAVLRGVTGTKSLMACALYPTWRDLTCL